MARVVQPAGTKGSLKWIQRAINEAWPSLNEPILSRIGAAGPIQWVSPMRSDDFAEYRDRDFLDVLGLGDLESALAAYWPQRGPQWDALGRLPSGEILLVEAKAHIGEMCTLGTSAKNPASRRLIESRLDELCATLGVRDQRVAWADCFYQLANRLAHLHFLRSRDVSAWLVLVNFTGDSEVEGPPSHEAWEAAYQVAFHAMGLPNRHRLTRYIIDVYPPVTG